MAVTGRAGDGRRTADPEAVIAALEAALAAGEERLAAQAAQIAELIAQVGRLTRQVEALTEKLGQNSTNSHLPPSSDGPGRGKGGASGGSKKSGSERKRGGQVGHRGAHRELLPPDLVDVFVDLFPEVCLGCAANLPHVHDPNAARYQQLDLRDRRPYVTECRRHGVECDRCGAWTMAAYDASRIPSSAFGPRLTAVVAMLTGTYHLSRRKAQRLLSELFGVSVSLGALSAMERRASEALATAYDEAKRELDAAAVKHSDATSWSRSGVLRSLWTLASVAATVFGIFVDGSRNTVRPLFGGRRGILVSDRASVFSFWLMEFRQICWAHLLRKFIAFSERDGPAGAIGRELLGYAALVFEYWHGFKEGALTREELQCWLRPVRREFELALERAASAEIPRLSRSCASILAHCQALWTFSERDGVEPTNNHAERELRAFVLWRKLSFGCQSERGERFAERMMTIAHTARKQGKSILDFIVASLTAHLDGREAPRLVGA